MGLAGWYKGTDILPDDNAANLIHHAFDRGVTFFDTSDVYGPHTSEILVGKVCPRADLSAKEVAR